MYNFWYPRDNNHEFRDWDQKYWWEHLFPHEEVTIVLSSLQRRCIYLHDQVERLQWGMQLKGTFIVKEAFDIQEGITQTPKETN